jgi:hypothetical protein
MFRHTEAFGRFGNECREGRRDRALWLRVADDPCSAYAALLDSIDAAKITIIHSMIATGRKAANG